MKDSLREELGGVQHSRSEYLPGRVSLAVSALQEPVARPCHTPRLSTPRWESFFVLSISGKPQSTPGTQSRATLNVRGFSMDLKSGTTPELRKEDQGIPKGEETRGVVPLRVQIPTQFACSDFLRDVFSPEGTLTSVPPVS